MLPSCHPFLVCSVAIQAFAVSAPDPCVAEQAVASRARSVFLLALSASLAAHVHAQLGALKESAFPIHGISDSQLVQTQRDFVDFVTGASPVHGFAPPESGPWQLDPAQLEALAAGRQALQDQGLDWTSPDFWDSQSPIPQKFRDYHGLASSLPTPSTKGPGPEQASAGIKPLAQPEIAETVASAGTGGIPPLVTETVPTTDPVLASGPRTSVQDSATEAASAAVPVPGDRPLSGDLPHAVPDSSKMRDPLLGASGTGFTSSSDADADPNQEPVGGGPTETSRAQFFCDLASREATNGVPQSAKELSLFKQAVVQQAVEAGRDGRYIDALTDMLARGDDGVTWRYMYDQVRHVHHPWGSLYCQRTLMATHPPHPWISQHHHSGSNP